MPRLLVSLVALVLVATACSLDNDPTIGVSGPTTTGAPGASPTTLSLPGSATTVPESTTTLTIPPGDRATVLRALDGDSLLVELDGVEEEVRLIGVNAPEGDECYGDVARDNLDQRIAGGEVILASNPDGDDRDRFGRLLRYAFAGTIDINRTLLANGQAVVLSADHPRQDEFRRVEDIAFAERLGLWGTAPCGGEGRLPLAVAIGDVASDPSGPDDEALNDEWVEVVNEGTIDADLTGWTLRDESSTNRYSFPDGFVLPPGASVLVHTGCGTDGAADLYWCAEGPVWNNGGDSALLMNHESTVIARFWY